MAGRRSDSEGRRNKSLWNSLVEAVVERRAVQGEFQKTGQAKRYCPQRGIKALTGRLSRLVSKDRS
jgi:hypothetical protein